MTPIPLNKYLLQTFVLFKDLKSSDFLSDFKVIFEKLFTKF